jgi:hypothetical protein
MQLVLILKILLICILASYCIRNEPANFLYSSILTLLPLVYNLTSWYVYIYLDMRVIINILDFKKYYINISMHIIICQKWIKTYEIMFSVYKLSRISTKNQCAWQLYVPCTCTAHKRRKGWAPLLCKSRTGSEPTSLGWVRGVVMHLTTQVQILSWTEFECLFLFLIMKNHLVPPRLDLFFCVNHG